MPVSAHLPLLSYEILQIILNSLWAILLQHFSSLVPLNTCSSVPLPAISEANGKIEYYLDQFRHAARTRK